MLWRDYAIHNPIIYKYKSDIGIVGYSNYKTLW